jgi:hypothetical protein
VPQEKRSPSMYITQIVCIIIKRNFNLIASIAGKRKKLTSKIYTGLVIYIYTYIYCTSKHPLYLFPCAKYVARESECIWCERKTRELTLFVPSRTGSPVPEPNPRTDRQEEKQRSLERCTVQYFKYNYHFS